MAFYFQAFVEENQMYKSAMQQLLQQRAAAHQQKIFTNSFNIRFLIFVDIEKSNRMSEEKSLNFIEEIVQEDLEGKKYKTILTRFPPGPNGYLHIGHAKSICLNFGLALKYGGATNLRFDDTNPTTEETEYVESIKDDIAWLGFKWANELYASDYFEQLYAFAVKLIKKGLAYVDDSTSEEIATHKGTPTQPGTRNKYADRGI